MKNSSRPAKRDPLRLNRSMTSDSERHPVGTGPRACLFSMPGDGRPRAGCTTMAQGLTKLNYEHRSTNHEYRSKRKNGNERIQPLVIQYSMFDIRHSEEDKNSELGIVTQPRGAVPTTRTTIIRHQNHSQKSYGWDERGRRPEL